MLLAVGCFVALTTNIAFAQAQEIKEAQHFIEIDQTSKAITTLEKATTTYPADASLWYYLGIAQIKKGQRDLASKSFDKGISLNAKEPLNYVGRGRLSMLENNAQKAQLDFDQALSITKSKNAPVLRAVSEALLIDPKNAAKAVTLLNKAKGVDDHDPYTHVALGDALLVQNNGGGAVSSYERAASLDGKIALPHYKIGLVYLRSRNYPSAQEAFSKAIQIDPNYTLAYKEQGELYYQMKDGPGAAKAYEKYMSMTENPEEGKLRYAFFLFMAKDFQKAGEIFNELVKKPDASITAYRFRAYALVESGKLEEASTAFSDFFAKAKPEEIEAADYTAYGKLLQKQGQDSLALMQFQKSIEKEPKQTELLQMMAESYYKTKKYPEAITAYENLKVIKTKWSSQDLYNVGRSYYFTDNFQKADTTFQKLVEVQPTMIVSHLWLARTKANLDPESTEGTAKPYYEKLIEVASPNQDKNKNELIEAYQYLGYYYFLKNDAANSMTNYKKVLALDPNDVKANEFVKAVQANSKPKK